MCCGTVWLLHLLQRCWVVPLVPFPPSWPRPARIASKVPRQLRPGAQALPAPPPASTGGRGGQSAAPARRLNAHHALALGSH
eukprot:449722-Rhodomonas_salina.1